MAIKDKDGNVYKLRGPNPMMKEQKPWDLKHVKLLNFNWKEETKKDTANPIQKFKEDYDVVDIGEKLSLELNPIQEDKVVAGVDDFLTGLKDSMPVAVVEKKEEPPKPKEEVSFDDKTKKLLDKNKVIVLCAPAIETEIKDELYGDSYKRTTYGSKTEFPAIIIEQNDFVLRFMDNL